MATKQKAKKSKVVRRDACDRLLRAAGAYLKLRGGSAIVAGPIGITDAPSLRGVPEFYLMIKIMGHKPLGNLKREVTGWLGWRREALVSVLSVTNVQVMEQKVEQAERLLARKAGS